MSDLKALAARAIPFLRDEGAKYEDDGSNEPLELAREIESALSRPAGGELPDDMPTAFGEWFGKNYPGPDTIISDPHWHAPRIWRAAQYAAGAAAPTQHGGEDAKDAERYRWLREVGHPDHESGISVAVEGTNSWGKSCADYPTGADLDAAIAAIAASREQGQ